MIFLTVGSQLPFDRLVRACDLWCERTGRSDIFGQIGDPGPHGYIPSHFGWERFVPPDKCDELFASAELIVAHAGMGSIISAMSLGKPIIIMPRRMSLGEHRNDHQLATVAEFEHRANVQIANDESALASKLDTATQQIPKGHSKCLPRYANQEFIEGLREFIHGKA